MIQSITGGDLKCLSSPVTPYMLMSNYFERLSVNIITQDSHTYNLKCPGKISF